MAPTLQRKSSGGIIFVIITKIITKEIVPRNYFVIISARMVPSHAQSMAFLLQNKMRELAPKEAALNKKKSLHTSWGDFSEEKNLRNVPVTEIAAIFAICDCDTHRGPQKSQRFPRQEKAMLHCDLRV